MRILLLLAVIGSAAAGAAADAQSWSASPGRGTGSHIRPGGPAPTPGLWKIRPARDRDGRPDRRRHRFLGFGGGIGVGGAPLDPYGNGFFADGGGEVLLRRGRPYYDYDRSYPYEWAPRAGGRPHWDEQESPAEPPARCTLERGVRVCRGW